MMTKREAIQNQVVSLFCEKLNLGVASLETDLIETGLLDSLKFVELLMQLEQQFGMKIVLDDLEIDTFRSITRIADFVINQNVLRRDT